ncbi:MAG TPA: c-type cytochrome biogenesis protein CcsB [Pseudonocardia sp.]|jgi:cytochrome c-type biogenesis protein CcsB|nr:c-type cytochrome biogenesis protein CcsB [Pseudonocardia sp.]
MLVNLTASTFSDYAFHSSVAIYLLALLLHLGEFARTRNVAAPERELVATTVGADSMGSEVAAGDRDRVERDPVEPADGGQGRRPWRERFGRMAVSLTVLGALVHISSVVLRGVAVHRWPWGNMYEFISAICLMAVLGWLVVLRRNPVVRPLGAFVLLPVEVLLFLAGTSLYVKAGPVMPALQSYWLSIHVTAISIASGLFMVAGVASIMFLLRRYLSPDGRGAVLLSRLPSAQALDRLTYRITIFAFPLYTFAVICGAIWAEAAWGRYWGWDPKETVAFVVWVVYAGYLHSRATAGWRTTGAAWINTVGFAAVLFNLFFINLAVSGFHSYAGL